jgi:16S rRNA (guanine966-N2)-methyltransferase
MKLRIIAGSLRGRTIQCPDKQLLFRPTLERTRRAVADMLQPVIGGSAAADLCAGSGSFGFEMLSRGAASVDFVENNRQCTGLIREHAEKFGVTRRCRIVEQDVAGFVRSCCMTENPYDIIFFDPPYEAGGMASLVPLLRRMLSPDGMLLFQRRKRLPETDGVAGESDTPYAIKKFGDTVVECYRF